MLHLPDILLSGSRVPGLEPAPGARWTLLVPSRELKWVDVHRNALAAEAVTPRVADGVLGASGGTVLVDPRGIVQHVGETVRDSLDAVRRFRTGERHPLAA